MEKTHGKGALSLARLLRGARRAVFFGGAGVSTASGIPDFRGAGGLYRRQFSQGAETLLSRPFFDRDPETFYAFYLHHVLKPDAKPNAAHLALARLEAMGMLACVVTQNIDGLHRQAGSRRVLELHGSALRSACVRCGAPMDLGEVYRQPGVPRCACGGVVKPGIVLYGEGLDEATVSEAVAAIVSCDLLVVGGTSLSVNPAASFALLAPGRLAIVNRDPTPLDARADLVIREPIAEVFAEVMEIIGDAGKGEPDDPSLG